MLFKKCQPPEYVARKEGRNQQVATFFRLFMGSNQAIGNHKKIWPIIAL
jgi:hypothetical protein